MPLKYRPFKLPVRKRLKPNFCFWSRGLYAYTWRGVICI